jgi:hypothetical protein
MRPPEELDTVDWAALTHAYGSAEDVPDLIRALYSADPEQVDEALGELFSCVLHQGSVYPATIEAVPFLAHAAAHARAKRDWLLMMLADMTDRGASPSAVERAVSARVAAVLPDLLPFLDDPARAVRRAAVRLTTAADAATRPAVVEHLIRRYEDDPVVEVRADALTALALLDADPAAVEARERAALDSGMPALRYVAALLAAERSGPPYAPAMVRTLAEAGADPDPGEDDFPFPALGTSERRVREVLDADPGTAVTVARHWIAEGDLGGRGSFQADQIACTWRSREVDAVALLTEALPHQRDPQRLALCLEGVARWISHVRRPDVTLLTTLLAHAGSEERRVAAAAQLALARAGDARVLTVTATPTPAALTVLAARTGDLDHQRRALRDPSPQHLDELLATLTPGAVTHLLPELKEQLRTRGVPLLARYFGTWGVHDAELLDLLARAADGTDAYLAVTAAVARARLSGDARPALGLLERLLGAGRDLPWHLAEAGRLAGAGTPLLPLVEELSRGAGSAWTTMSAAAAHWRITRDPERAVPILAEIAGPSPVGLSALQALAETGTAPEDLRPALRHWAYSPRRLLATTWPPAIPNPDDELRDAALRLLG